MSGHPLRDGLPVQTPSPNGLGHSAGIPDAARILAGQIKALSIKQPWPHRIFTEGKDIENRDWPTKGRGWFIIHAGKTTDGIPAAYGNLPLGGIVGMARIVDCVDKSDSPWFFGRYGFALADAFPVDLIPCKGQLGFFMPPQEALVELAKAIEARSDKTGTGLAVGESADPKGFAQGDQP